MTSLVYTQIKMTALEERVRLGILENRLENLSSVIIPACLNQLDQQGRNICCYQEDENWEGLRREQRNAARTIKQLNTHVHELEDVKEQVNDEELAELKTTIEPIQRKILTAVASFQEIEPYMKTLDVPSEEDYIMINPEISVDESVEAWEELQHDLQELQRISQELTDQVKIQSEVITHIDEEVEDINSKVQYAVFTVNSMARIKANMLPISGALLGGVVGGVIGGPVGLVAGLKAGTITAVAGGTAGAVGGGIIGYIRGKTLKQSTEELTSTTSLVEDKKNI